MTKSSLWKFREAYKVRLASDKHRKATTLDGSEQEQEQETKVTVSPEVSEANDA